MYINNNQSTMPVKLKIVSRSASASPSPSPSPSVEHQEIPASFKSHPIYTQFFACEETGKIVWKKDNNKIKQKYPSKTGFLRLSVEGGSVVTIKQEEFIADIFKPKPKETVKMERKGEKWIIIKKEDYNPKEHDDYIPPRYIEWEAVDESRRKVAEKRKSGSQSPILPPLERATNDILRPAAVAAAAENKIVKRPSVSSASSSQSDHDDYNGECPQCDLYAENIEGYKETIEELRQDRDTLIRRDQRTRDEIIDAEKDDLKAQIRKMFSLLSPEQATAMKLELSKTMKSFQLFGVTS